MNTTHNGFRFAELARGESLQSQDVCDCCGREGLKKTVKLISPEGRVVWFGVGCAAKAMGVGVDVAREARKAAIETEQDRVKADADRARRQADEAWQTFLDARAGAGRDRFSQIDRLGGYKAARAMFEAAE